ncbi:MAG: phosphatidylglycerol lysyltransferase domain-containing protein [Oscillospiraceae bacterium]
MINFKKIQITDKSWILPTLQHSNFQSQEYNFTNNFIWKDVFNVQVANHNGFYLVKSGKENPSYVFPAGKGDLKKVIEEMMEDAKMCGHAFCMHSLFEESVVCLESLFPHTFVFTQDRDYADYIYLSEKLQTLSGKKLHSKRNHINRFKENNLNWIYESVTKENLQECYAMNVAWCHANNCEDDDDKKSEQCAVKNCFEYFEALGLQGGMIKVDGNIVAFSFGEPLNSDTFIVHIEKAFSDIQGAYPIINQQFAVHNAVDFTYINREDDMGAEGLRKAKLSYYPENILIKHNVCLKGCSEVTLKW